MTSPRHEFIDRDMLTQFMFDLDQDGDPYRFLAYHGASMVELFLSSEGKTPGHEDVRVLLKNDGTWEMMSIAVPIVVNDPFSAYNAEFALAEGWGMFNVDGRYHLQRNDEMGAFETDADAIMYVANKAADSALHRAAIGMIGALVE